MVSAFVSGGVAFLGKTTLQEFLAANEGAVYTSMRTMNGNNICDMKQHIQQLAKSASTKWGHRMESHTQRTFEDALTTVALHNAAAGLRLLGHSPTKSPLGDCFVVTVLQQTLAAVVRPAMMEEAETSCVATEDVKAVEVIAGVGLQQWSVVTPLRQHPAQVRVEVRRGDRRDPTVKSAAWVRERSALEKDKLTDSNEVLMATADGRVSEGITSNFFAVKNGELWTAPADSVLDGTVRRTILDLAAEQGWVVREQAPALCEAHMWSGCFITSSSRFVRSVVTLLDLRGPEVCHAFPATCPFIAEVQHAVEACLLQRSTAIPL